MARRIERRKAIAKACAERGGPRPEIVAELLEAMSRGGGGEPVFKFRVRHSDAPYRRRAYARPVHIGIRSFNCGFFADTCLLSRELGCCRLVTPSDGGGDFLQVVGAVTVQ
jgi:hypothetical protein